MLRAAENEVPSGRAGGRRLRRGFRRGPPRRGKITRQRAHLFFPRFSGPVGPEKSAARVVEYFQLSSRQRRKHSCVPPFQLDRTRRLALHPCRKYPHRAPLFRQETRRGTPQRFHCGDRSSHTAPARRENATREVPHEVARMRSLHGSNPFRCRHRTQDYRGNGVLPPLRTRKPRHRPRRRRLHGTQEARGLLLMISSLKNIPHSTFSAFLEQDLNTDLLRFTTAGSVDDGKSTLIGRLLHDSKAVYEDQLASVKKSRINHSTGPLDFSLLTDGLRAEREQGITIDVAYRYFATARRKFIIADTPGHEQYTRNMATGASTADLAVILIDGTKGILPQTRRHAFIASLLGISNVLAAVNKMDLAGYREVVFRKLQDDFLALAAQLGIATVQCAPISALEGDNVVDRYNRMPWYHGPTLLEHLETVPVTTGDALERLRFPIQMVIRPDANFRGFAGRLASGVVRPGDDVVALPSGRKTRVRSIVSYDGDLPEAFAPMSVTLQLENEIDLSRGDMLVSPEHGPRVSKRFQAMVVWLHGTPMEVGRTYLVQHTAKQTKIRAVRIGHCVNIHTLEPEHATQLNMNDIASVEFEAHAPLFFDPYTRNRATGSFILID